MIRPWSWPCWIGWSIARSLSNSTANRTGPNERRGSNPSSRECHAEHRLRAAPRPTADPRLAAPDGLACHRGSRGATPGAMSLLYCGRERQGIAISRLPLLAARVLRSSRTESLSLLPLWRLRQRSGSLVRPSTASASRGRAGTLNPPRTRHSRSRSPGSSNHARLALGPLIQQPPSSHFAIMARFLIAIDNYSDQSVNLFFSSVLIRVRPGSRHCDCRNF